MEKEYLHFQAVDLSSVSSLLLLQLKEGSIHQPPSLHCEDFSCSKCQTQGGALGAGMDWTSFLSSSEF